MAGSEELGQLKVLLSAQTAEYIAELEKAKGKSREVGEDTKTTTSGISSAWGVLTGAGAATVAVLGAVAGATGYLIGEASAAQEAQAQLNAVLASTGGVAGVTADKANELAGAYQNTTRYSDEEILSAESLMLTFTQISDDVFPDAIGAVLDMATALKMDLQGATTMVSKALNVQAGDTAAATTAMNAMRRSGVVFTSEQIELGKQLVATGDVMGYQQMILKELQTEYGGSAAAAGGTLAGAQDILNNKLSDVAETWGGALLPVAQEFVEGVTPILIDTLNVLTQTELPAFVELVGRASGALLTAVEAGALLITWNDRLSLAYQEQNDRLLETTTSYADYQAGLQSAAAAMGEQVVFTDELTAAQAETMDVQIGLTEAQYNAVIAGKALEAQDAKLALAYSTYAVAAEGATGATSANTDAMSEASVAAGLLDGAIAQTVSGYDALKTATNLVESAIDALSETEVDAARKKLVLEIATQNLTAADIEDRLEKLQLLEVLQQLNVDIEAGTANNEEYYAVVLGGVTTMEQYNTMMGTTSNTISDAEVQMWAAKNAASSLNSELGAIPRDIPVTITITTVQNGGGAGDGTGDTTFDQRVDGNNGGSSPSSGPRTMPGRGGGASVYIENLYVNADSASELLEQLYSLR